MKKLHGLGILMAIVLLAIAGFQVYWIRDNYNREQKAVEVKAQALFRETVREVQDAVLQKKLRLVLKDTTASGDAKKTRLEGHVKMRPGAPGTARVLHLLSEQLEVDSGDRKKGVYIRVDNGELPPGNRVVADSIQKAMLDQVVVLGGAAGKGATPGSVDSQQSVWARSRAGNDSIRGQITEVSTIYFNTRQGDNFKISIDSLFRDSLPVKDLDTAYSKKLREQKLDIPFRILHQPNEKKEQEDFIRRPFSFESFEGYKLELGNSFSYLIKRISLPILFSIFLVGLSVLSFALLYRGLLRQHKLAEMKNDLISNITHELKTPIATVGVAIEALKNFNAIQDPKKTKEYLDISQNELQRLGLLVDKVLKLSMFENNSIEIKKEMFDLEDVVNEVISSLRLQLEKSKATIRVNAAGNLLVNGDRLHLVSVVFNLLDNALKYNKGSVDIQVNLEEKNENIVLNVVDNGIGIPHQYKQKIFEKFFRVPSGNTHNAKGHGLGLSYVAKVVHQHRGSIKVDSREGTGSSFTILLPKPVNPQNVQV